MSLLAFIFPLYSVHSFYPPPPPSGINVTDTFDAIKMLDKVTPEMRALGDGAIPYDGGLYPVRLTAE